MRGALINPFTAEIARLDTVATKADPDGAGPATSGYDDVFREPIVIDDSDPTTNVRTFTRAEQNLIRVPCQVETNPRGVARVGVRAVSRRPISFLSFTSKI